MRSVPAVSLAAAFMLLASPALPQTAPQPPAARAPAAPETSLQQDQAVRQSQQPEPAPQGTRSPDALPSDTENSSLTQALMAIWNAPVDLQGNRIQRPNPAASQPLPSPDPAAAMPTMLSPTGPPPAPGGGGG